MEKKWDRGFGHVLDSAMCDGHETSKHLYLPLVVGCSIGHKPLVAVHILDSMYWGGVMEVTKF